MKQDREHGLVFNIQKFCVHDGPGIRSIVFFKGCPLSCKWCSNPEGISAYPELAYKKSKCITMEKCGLCVRACPRNAIAADTEGRATIRREVCDACMACVDACPAKAIERMGRLMTVEEILEEITSDAAFFARSGGGMTLSGGEPLLQAEFVTSLLLQARAEGLESAIETTGCVPWEQAEPVFRELDFIYFDLKMLDPVKHRTFTGRSNERILENFKRLCVQFGDKPIVARTPVIPGVNDTVDDIQRIADFIGEAGKHAANLRYELLPFHNFGSSKYEFQNKAYLFENESNMDNAFISVLKQQINASVPLI